MNVLDKGMHRIDILLIFLLLAACTTEKPVITVASQIPSKVTPKLTAEIPAEATSEITPFPIVTEGCARGDYFDQIESGGQARQYLLHVPATYTPEEPAALVLVFHGAGIGAERFVSYSRFSNVADREGFLIVYPQGMGAEPVWNPSPGSRDVQFIRDLIDHLQRRCFVDPNRIYASGHSNGGGMVDRLACELADRIAAIGTISGAYQRAAECSPSRPVPVFAIHGTADTIVPYEGIPEWAAAWAERNGCDPEPVDIPHNVLISEKKWSNCRGEADVILYTIQDLGHDWTHDLINFGQTIWGFFEQHPLGSHP
jgi:polyhydroxybutyrate depolymerase